MVGLLAGAAKGLMKKPQKINPDKFAGKMEDTKASSEPKGGALAVRPVESIVKVVDIKPKDAKIKAKGGPLAEIQEGVHAIVIALKGEQDAKKKKAVAQKNKNQKKKRLNLEALSELGKTAGNIAGGLASATGITKLWGAIWKTLGILFAGWAMNFLPQILGFVKKFIDITTNVIKVAKPIVGFIWDTLTWITDKGVKLLAMVTGIEPEEALDNSMLSNITEIQKRIPLIEAAFAWFAILKVANFFKKDNPDAQRRQDTKNKNRNRRNTEGTKTRTGKQHQLEVKRRRANLKKIKQNKVLNKVRRTLGLEEVDIKPQLDTTPTGTRKSPVVETPKTKVKVDTPSTPKKPRGNFLGIDWGKRASQISEGAGNLKKGAIEGFQTGVRRASEFGDVVYRNTIGKIDEQLKKLDPGTILKNLAGGDGPLKKASKGLLGLLDSPLTRKILGAAPFLGDAVVFLMDLMTGKHWVRALLRTVGAVGVDAGFYGLLALTGIAAPFSAGSSLALSAALISAYMAADAMAGAALGNEGIGQFLGDFVADKLGVPKMAGETGSGKWESLFGSGGKINNSQGSVDKLIEGVKLSEKEKEAISKVGGGLGDPDVLKGDVPKMAKEFEMGKKTYNLSKLMGGLSREEYDALGNSERNRLDRRIRMYASQNPPNIKGKDANVKSNDATAISQSASYDDKAGKSTIIPVPIGDMQSGSSGGTTLVGAGDGVNTYETVNKLNKTGALSKHFSD